MTFNLSTLYTETNFSNRSSSPQRSPHSSFGTRLSAEGEASQAAQVCRETAFLLERSIIDLALNSTLSGFPIPADKKQHAATATVLRCPDEDCCYSTGHFVPRPEGWFCSQETFPRPRLLSDLRGLYFQVVTLHVK